MPSPSISEFDSSTPDASAASSSSEQPPSSIETNNPLPEVPSTSGQPAILPPPSSIECDPSNPPSEISSTLGQPTMRPPLSSIECDPNNPPPETPSSQNQPVTVENNFTFFEKVAIQLPVWKQHLRDFRNEVIVATIVAMFAVAFFVAAYAIQVNIDSWGAERVMQWKTGLLGAATVLCAVCFSFIWLAISEGPPFKSDDKGNAIKPSYLLPEKLSNSAYDLSSPTERNLIGQQEDFVIFEESSS